MMLGVTSLMPAAAAAAAAVDDGCLRLVGAAGGEMEAGPSSPGPAGSPCPRLAGPESPDERLPVSLLVGATAGRSRWTMGRTRPLCIVGWTNEAAVDDGSEVAAAHDGPWSDRKR